MTARIATLAAGFGTADLRRVLAAWALASVGNWAVMVILAIHAFAVGGTAGVALAAAVRLAPAAVAAPFVSGVVDRRPRRVVIVVALLLRAAALLAVTGVVVAGGPLGAVLVPAALFSVVSTVHRPAQAALLPALAWTPQQLAAANALLSTSSNGGFLVGTLAGAVIAAAAGVEVAFAAAAATFVVAAAIQRRVTHAGTPVAEPEDGGLAREVAAGVRALQGPRLRVVIAAFGAASVVEGAADVLIVLLAIEVLDLGQAGVGYLNAAWGAGGLTGAAVAGAALAHGRLALGLSGGAAAIGATIAALGVAPAAGAAVVLLVLVGVAYAFVDVAETTLLQRFLPDRVLGRAFGVVEGVYVGASAAGSLAAPALVAALGVRGALVACGGAVGAVAIAVWPALARVEAAAPVGEREFGLVRGVPFLAVLPLGVLERLARHAVPVPMAAGEVVLREGDRGDRFYVIAGGEVTVSEHGAHRRTEAAGEFFGEIALLRDVPRTATVVATRPGDLLALERDDFLAAVTGQAGSAEAAGAVVRERLSAA